MSNTLLALDVLNTAATHVQHAQHFIAASVTVPDGDPVAPAGWTEKFGKVIGIAKWILLPLAVLALIATGAALFQQNRHDGGEIQQRLIKIGFGLFLGLGSTSAVAFLIS
jgi:hypothetical protein